ncbi:hypothetical protein R1flu_004821 [Riccia fluitans]|uniref:Uncharacterized protein n=1 Tax=Riccia fluitans TaxID=41844 RepID=A0ABD1YUF5_9MARC
MSMCCGYMDFVAEFERNRIALQAARSLLHKNNEERETLRIARALLLQTRMNVSLGYPSSTDFEGSYQVNYLVNEIGGSRAINPADISPRDYKCGTILWIGCVITALGESLLKFISRIVGRLENREFF